MRDRPILGLEIIANIICLTLKCFLLFLIPMKHENLKSNSVPGFSYLEVCRHIQRLVGKGVEGGRFVSFVHQGGRGTFYWI